MVLFVDLEDEVEPPELNGVTPYWSRGGFEHGGIGERRSLPVRLKQGDRGVERGNPNKNAVTEALGCYPIISAITFSIDLNTLDSLSLTCRQVRANLLQFRTQLLASTLRCCNEDVVPNLEHTLRYRARAADWYFIEEGGANVNGKVGSCARDMVAECRRCGKVVCRNCTIKPPAPILLRHRYRRICKTCSRAPLPTITISHLSASTPLSVSTIKRETCTCPSEGVWLCQPCGRSLRSTDSEYESIWKWRTRYLPSLGGLGVGIGEGDRGVECGRERECCAAREVEQEIDCDAEDAREIDASTSGNNGRTISPSSSPGSERGQMGPGYARHEIEGIGGVVKRKLVRMVRVGACVPEWEDEKEMGRFLVKEVEGRARSWCGWCWRVIPGVKDGVE